MESFTMIGSYYSNITPNYGIIVTDNGHHIGYFHRQSRTMYLRSDYKQYWNLRYFNTQIRKLVFAPEKEIGDKVAEILKAA